MTDHPDDAARLREMSREIRSIAVAAGQCSIEGPQDSKSLMAAAEAERCSRWADAIDSLTARETEGIEGLIQRWEERVKSLSPKSTSKRGAINTCINELKALVSRATRAHKWKTQRVGGDPTEASSAERVTFCDECATPSLSI